MSGYHIKDESASYFLTFTVVGWIDIFSRQVYRDLIIDSFEYARKKKGLLLYAYVIMTNHIHLLAQAKEDYKLSAIVRDFKKFTSKKVYELLDNSEESRREWMKTIFLKAGALNKDNKTFQLWKQDNHPVAVYSDYVINQKIEYIHNNPVKAGFVSNPEDWTYSSARNYSDLDYVLEIDFVK
jgi:REP element-mobilizing transposase RayT